MFNQFVVKIRSKLQHLRNLNALLKYNRKNLQLFNEKRQIIFGNSSVV